MTDRYGTEGLQAKPYLKESRLEVWGPTGRSGEYRQRPLKNGI